MRHLIRHSGPLLAAVAASALCGCAGTLADQPGVAARPACPPVATYAAPNAPMPTEGCWNAANLARMVVDPSDLAQGKRLGDASGAREALAVEAYQTGQQKPLSQGSGATAGLGVLTLGGAAR